MGDQEVAALGAGLVRIKGLGPEDASVTYALQVLEARGPQALGAGVPSAISMSF